MAPPNVYRFLSLGFALWNRLYQRLFDCFEVRSIYEPVIIFKIGFVRNGIYRGTLCVNKRCQKNRNNLATTVRGWQDSSKQKINALLVSKYPRTLANVRKTTIPEEWNFPTAVNGWSPITASRHLIDRCTRSNVGTAYATALSILEDREDNSIFVRLEKSALWTTFLYSGSRALTRD